VEVSKHQRTTFKYIYSLLSAQYNVSTNATKNLYNNSGIKICIGEIIFVAETRLFVLQTGGGSLQSPDCDTEWIICINVGTGGGLCRKGIIRI